MKREERLVVEEVRNKRAVLLVSIWTGVQYGMYVPPRSAGKKTFKQNR